MDRFQPLSITTILPTTTCSPEILNSSYRENRLPSSWKMADVSPLPKQKPVLDVSKHLRPISLTPIISKLVEEFVVDRFIKPAACSPSNS